MENKQVKGSSNIWCGITIALHIIGKWMASIPINGACIQVGLDIIVGAPYSIKLSSVLIDILHRSWRTFLKDYKKNECLEDCNEIWLDAKDLDIEGEHGDEWNNYMHELKLGVISLSNKKYALEWTSEKIDWCCPNQTRILYALAFISS